jgi:hypothetical protein
MLSASGATFPSFVAGAAPARVAVAAMKAAADTTLSARFRFKTFVIDESPLKASGVMHA